MQQRKWILEAMRILFPDQPLVDVVKWFLKGILEWVQNRTLPFRVDQVSRWSFLSPMSISISSREFTWISLQLVTRPADSFTFKFCLMEFFFLFQSNRCFLLNAEVESEKCLSAAFECKIQFSSWIFFFSYKIDRNLIGNQIKINNQLNRRQTRMLWARSSSGKVTTRKLLLPTSSEEINEFWLKKIVSPLMRKTKLWLCQ